jgi:hypothetical protein
MREILQPSWCCEWFRNGPYTCSYMCTWFKYGDHEKMMLSSNWGELWYAGDELNIAVGNIIKPSIWYLAGSTGHLHGFTLKYESCNEKLLISGFGGTLYANKPTLYIATHYPSTCLQPTPQGWFRPQWFSDILRVTMFSIGGFRGCKPKPPNDSL